MKLRILHCVLDDKFIDSMIAVMDETEDCCENDYVIVSNRNDCNYNYIKQTSRVHILSNDDFISYLDRKSIHVVMVHGMFSLNPELIIKIRKEIKVVWLAWGYDIYEPIFNYRALIKIHNLYHFWTRAVRCLEWLLHPRQVIYNIRLLFTRSYFEEAIRRIDYFSGVIPDEYDMIVNNPDNHFFKAEKVGWHYFSINSSYDENHLNSPYVDGDNIQIGNSGDPTNNHLDIMRSLGKLKLSGKKVYVPMGYGGSRTYLSFVRKYGYCLWKDNFIPLINFIPKDEYFKILCMSRYALFYHERQQAMGNVLTALWYGCMVFVSETSPVCNYLQTCGFHFFTIQHDLHRIENGEKLSYEEMKHNRMIYIKYYSPSVCFKTIITTLGVLDGVCRT